MTTDDASDDHPTLSQETLDAVAEAEAIYDHFMNKKTSRGFAYGNDGAAMMTVAVMTRLAANQSR